jgi:hypothetical protein
LRVVEAEGGGLIVCSRPHDIISTRHIYKLRLGAGCEPLGGREAAL